MSASNSRIPVSKLKRIFLEVASTKIEVDENEEQRQSRKSGPQSHAARISMLQSVSSGSGSDSDHDSGQDGAGGLNSANASRKKKRKQKRMVMSFGDFSKALEDVLELGLDKQEIKRIWTLLCSKSKSTTQKEVSQKSTIHHKTSLRPDGSFRIIDGRFTDSRPTDHPTNNNISSPIAGGAHPTRFGGGDYTPSYSVISRLITSTGMTSNKATSSTEQEYLTFKQFCRAIMGRQILKNLMSTTIIRRELQKFSIPAEYDFTKTTAQNYNDPTAKCIGPYKHLRDQLDYSYHARYSEKRQKWQDDLVSLVVTKTRPVHRPWLILSAGAMGAGKGHVMRWLSSSGFLPLEQVVHIDPDIFKTAMPEWGTYTKINEANAGSQCHNESGCIQEICQEIALRKSQNVWIDGSLRNAPWFVALLQDIRKRFHQYRIAIFYVYASEETIRARCLKRAKLTGRMIPEAQLIESLEAPQKTIIKLMPYCDLIARIENENRPRLVVFEQIDRSGSFYGMQKNFENFFTAGDSNPFVRFPLQFTSLRMDLGLYNAIGEINSRIIVRDTIRSKYGIQSQTEEMKNTSEHHPYPFFVCAENIAITTRNAKGSALGSALCSGSLSNGLSSNGSFKTSSPIGQPTKLDVATQLDVADSLVKSTIQLWQKLADIDRKEAVGLLMNGVKMCAGPVAPVGEQARKEGKVHPHGFLFTFVTPVNEDEDNSSHSPTKEKNSSHLPSPTKEETREEVTASLKEFEKDLFLVSSPFFGEYDHERTPRPVVTESNGGYSPRDDPHHGPSQEPHHSPSQQHVVDSRNYGLPLNQTEQGYSIDVRSLKDSSAYFRILDELYDDETLGRYQKRFGFQNSMLRTHGEVREKIYKSRIGKKQGTRDVLDTILDAEDDSLIDRVGAAPSTTHPSALQSGLPSALQSTIQTARTSVANSRKASIIQGESKTRGFEPPNTALESIPSVTFANSVVSESSSVPPLFSHENTNLTGLGSITNSPLLHPTNSLPGTKKPNIVQLHSSDLTNTSNSAVNTMKSAGKLHVPCPLHDPNSDAWGVLPLSERCGWLYLDYEGRPVEFKSWHCFSDQEIAEFEEELTMENQNLTTMNVLPSDTQMNLQVMTCGSPNNSNLAYPNLPRPNHPTSLFNKISNFGLSLGRMTSGFFGMGKSIASPRIPTLISEFSLPRENSTTSTATFGTKKKKRRPLLPTADFGSGERLNVFDVPAHRTLVLELKRSNRFCPISVCVWSICNLPQLYRTEKYAWVNPGEHYGICSDGSATGTNGGFLFITTNLQQAKHNVEEHAENQKEEDFQEEPNSYYNPIIRKTILLGAGENSNNTNLDAADAVCAIIKPQAILRGIRYSRKPSTVLLSDRGDTIIQSTEMAADRKESTPLSFKSPITASVKELLSEEEDPIHNGLVAKGGTMADSSIQGKHSPQTSPTHASRRASEDSQQSSDIGDAPGDPWGLCDVSDEIEITPKVPCQLGWKVTTAPTPASAEDPTGGARRTGTTTAGAMTAVATAVGIANNAKPDAPVPAQTSVPAATEVRLDNELDDNVEYVYFPIASFGGIARGYMEQDILEEN